MPHALELAGVGKDYRTFALRDVSFSLPRGYIMGLIGPNGAGKTTLIKLILNLVRRDRGSIRVNGLDNLDDERRVKARIGFVPDEPRFQQDASLARIASTTAPFYPQWDERRFGELADRFGLPMDRRFKRLSHGTKTKFALALALSHGADLILLDEPTSGLDPAFRRELLALLGDVLQDGQVSILFSTHITADLERTADFITFIKQGRLVFSTPKDEVLSTFRIVKGGREALDDGVRDLFDGLRVTAHGFEGLTSRADDARRRFGTRVAIERATLDDVMVLMDGEADHAA